MSYVNFLSCGPFVRKDDACVLCREPLIKGRVNLEHYIHQVLIRNFDKLCVPAEFDWALRKHTRPGAASTTLAPVKDHKRWATVRVHAKCNSDMSFIGQDFKYIIEHIDENIPDYKFLGLFHYYSNLWNVDPYSLVVRILTIDEVHNKYSNKKCDIIYEPYLLSVGRIEIECPSERRVRGRAEEDKVLYTVMLGTHEALTHI